MESSRLKDLYQHFCMTLLEKGCIDSPFQIAVSLMPLSTDRAFGAYFLLPCDLNEILLYTHYLAGIYIEKDRSIDNSVKDNLYLLRENKLITSAGKIDLKGMVHTLKSRGFKKPLVAESFLKKCFEDRTSIYGERLIHNTLYEQQRRINELWALPSLVESILFEIYSQNRQQYLCVFFVDKRYNGINQICMFNIFCSQKTADDLKEKLDDFSKILSDFGYCLLHEYDSFENLKRYFISYTEGIRCNNAKEEIYSIIKGLMRNESILTDQAKIDTLECIEDVIRYSSSKEKLDRVLEALKESSFPDQESLNNILSIINR